MKKLLCFILSALIIMSSFTALTVFAKEETPKDEIPEYLLGDADTDGKVTIIDATEIQMFLADMEELSGLQVKLSDIDGKGVSIVSATYIQQYLADISTGYGIGEKAGDEKEGVIYWENQDLYYPSGNSFATDEQAVYFSTAYPDVVFVSDDTAMTFYTDFYGYEDNDIIKSDGEDSRTYEVKDLASVTFDYGTKALDFSDYTTFLTKKGKLSFHPFGPDISFDGGGLYMTMDNSRYFGGDPCELTFDYDQLPMLRDGDSILIPLQTLSDFFLSYTGKFLQYNGEALFLLDSTIPGSGNPIWDLYNGIEKRDTVSYALARVNYYELCSILEARYGLKKAHDIDDFDSYFKRRDLKADFLSANVRRMETALYNTSVLLFEDFHSGLDYFSPYLDGKIDDDTRFSPVFQNRLKRFNAIKETRNEKLGEYEPYQRIGDTVFITFDGFNFDPVKPFTRFYDEGFVPSPNKNDTLELFFYALERLKNEDSDAKNVVVDVSCNGGGVVFIADYILDALIGKGILCLYNPNTSAITQNVTRFDLNFDGVIDDNDISMKQMGKNISIITSDVSFSCGNLLPCALNALDDDILIMGQQSGGGSCEVGYISTAIGSIMQISCEKQMVTMKNGYIRDIDDGVSPEVSMSLSGMYDRNYVVDVVDDYFNV